MICCRICKKEFKLITNSHLLKNHQMTPEEYLTRFPDAALYDQEMHDKITRTRWKTIRPICARPDCGNKTTQSWNKYCSYHCSMSHRMSKNGRNEQCGLRNPQATDGSYSLGKKQKRLARERDQFHCRKCGLSVNGKSAHVHHKIPEDCFSTIIEAHDLKNLVTLCDKCHLAVEWIVIKELYSRAIKFDKIMESIPGHVKLSDFIDGLFET